MPTPLELVGNSVPLKDDNARISIEGVLAGASLAVVLSILMPEMVEAAEWAQKLLDGPGPIESNPLEDGGRPGQNRDQIQIQPLNPSQFLGIDPVDLSQEGVPRDASALKPFREPPISGIVAGVPVSNPVNAATSNGDSLGDQSGDPLQRRVTRPIIGDSLNPEYPNPEYPPVALNLVEDKRYIKIDVNSPVSAVSSSVDDVSNAFAKLSLVGLDSTSIQISPLNYLGRAISYNEGKLLKDTTDLPALANSGLARGNFISSGLDIGQTPTISIATTGVVDSVARSLKLDAYASTEAQNNSVLNSQVVSLRDAAEFISIKATDFIDLLTQAGRLAAGKIISTTSGLTNTNLSTGDRSDSILIHANTTTDVQASQGNDGLFLDIGVNTIGLDGSTIKTNKGDDEIQVISKMDNIKNSDLPGFNININRGLEPLHGDIGISLNSTALKQSSIDTGAGNDRIFVDSGIDEYLASQIKPSGAAEDHNLKINISKSIISLDQSSITTGLGNDIVLLRGDVVDSKIDLGSGNNQLVIQGNIDSDSSIKINDNDVYINIPLYGRTEQLSNADDTWFAKDSSDVSLVLAGDGNDTLESRGNFNERVEIIGNDVGMLYNTAFISTENINLGAGNDVVLFKKLGSLSGMLDGGSGIDTLSYEYSQNNLLYSGQDQNSLNFDSATSRGLSGFEHLIGSNHSDIIVISNDSKGFVDPLRNITLGLGSDLIAFNDVNTLVKGWDGIGGAPIIENFDLSMGDQFAYRNDHANDSWMIQKDIIALPNDILNLGISDGGFGLAIGISNEKPTNGSLYLTGQLGGNVELAKLINFTLPASQNISL